MELLGVVGQVEDRFGVVGDMLISAQDRCTVWGERTIGLEIIFGTTNGTPRRLGSNKSSFRSIWR
jgi:hypothetical protein